MNRRQVFQLFAGAVVAAGIPAVLIPASPDLLPIGELLTDCSQRFDLIGMPYQFYARATIGQDEYDYFELHESLKDWATFHQRAMRAAKRAQRELADGAFRGATHREQRA